MMRITTSLELSFVVHMRSKKTIALLILLNFYIFAQKEISFNRVKNLVYPADISYIQEETIIYWSDNGEKTIATKARVYYEPYKMRTEYLAPLEMTDIVLIDDGEYVYSIHKNNNVAIKLEKSALSFEGIDKNQCDLMTNNYMFRVLKKKRYFQGEDQLLFLLMQKIAFHLPEKSS